MDKEQVLNEDVQVSSDSPETGFESMSAKQIWEKCYNQELSTKKHILEYIEAVKELSKEKINKQQIEEAYDFIEEHIEAMKTAIKPNTILYLKQELSAKLGKFVAKRQTQSDNHFFKFFMEAYPKNKRYKEYTWVLMDLNKINEDQMLHTLKYINAWCLKNKLSGAEKRDIIEFVKKLVDKGNVKYINQIKSLEGLGKALKTKIVVTDGKFNVKENKKKTKVQS